ncbi:MAG: DNA repair protein RecN [Oscillospiraceae bacterium]|nr:DNA repair protein RecN [Oscillospiraceae bacterium]
MLSEIYIENLAVIKKACISFKSGFNAFTGETGAGKSILIGGINAVLGQRITKDIVRSGCEKAVVSALFTDIDESVKSVLSESGFDIEENDLVITREIRADGGSVARINSRTAPVSLLRDIGNLLVNIHGQHDSQVLLNSTLHLAIVENFNGDFSLLESYKSSFRELQSVAKQLKSLKAAESEKQQRIAFLDRQIEDIEKYNLKAGEYDELSAQYALAKDAEAINLALQTATSLLNDEDICAVSNVYAAEAALEDVSDSLSSLSELLERLSQTRLEIQDISQALTALGSSLSLDEEHIDYVVKRFEKLERIKKLYNMEIDELIAVYEGYKSERDTLESSDREIEKLNEKRGLLLEQATKKAKELSAFRAKIADDFCNRVALELEFLNMPGVKIVPYFEQGKLTLNGMDSFELLISANVGECPKPISKIASGGELSRIMLALKNVIADKDSIPTLIFDEVDAGVSGKAAQKIGIKLKEISRLRQVICVTHLAQIAVMANEHILIEKSLVDGRTQTSVKSLDFEERTAEIARIMGGENPSELMLENARSELAKYMD